VVGEGRHRLQRRPAAEEEHDQEQGRRVDHAGYRRAAAVLDVGRGARDGADGRDAAEERHHEVRHPLRHQLRARAVAAAGHASATTAESSDSVPATNAIATAEGISWGTISQSIAGSDGDHPDDHPGPEVAQELGARDPLAQAGDELGLKAGVRHGPSKTAPRQTDGTLPEGTV
jgi:hypothetical protein